MKTSLLHFVFVWTTVGVITGKAVAFNVDLGIAYNVTATRSESAVNFRESNPETGVKDLQISDSSVTFTDRDGRSYAAASSSSNSNNHLNLSNILKQILAPSVKGGTWRPIQLWGGESRAESVVSASSVSSARQRQHSFFLFILVTSLTMLI